MLPGKIAGLCIWMIVESFYYFQKAHLVDSDMEGFPLITFDTVAIDTPASLATSLIVSDILCSFFNSM